MTLAATVSEALARDALAEACAAALEAVRTAPADLAARHLLIDLLILDGNYERADAHCAIGARLSPGDAMGLARLRAELRGMSARAAFFREMAAPDIPGGPTPSDEHALRLALACSAGDSEEAATELRLLEAARGRSALSIDGGTSQDVRDGDDRVPHALEAISPGGAYLWLKFSMIAALDLHPMTRPRHLAFRSADVTLTDGSASPVLLPAIYHGSDASDRFKLGRETNWEREPSGITIGRGQRCLLVGDDLVALHEITTMTAAGSVSDQPLAEAFDG